MKSSSRPTRRAVLQGLAAGSAACILGELAPAEARTGLPRATPQSVGVDPSAVLAFIEGIERKYGGLHGFVLLRHGQVAAEGWWEPYGPEYPHMLYSLSKSFTSTAVGLAVEEGRLSVDSRVTSFFKDDLPAVISPNLRAMRVRHLLSMSTGHEKDATNPMRSAPGGDWVRAFLSLPVEREPGSLFVYNSAATYMCSAIVQKLTGMTVLDYLRPRLFEPLGIENPTWEKCPKGINTGGWGLKVTTEDIARFGQLYLQRGKWRGRQLVPEAWVAQATSKQISNGSNPNSDWNQGYGYQFWRCRHNAFRGDGAFGQYCVVMPDQDAVLAITSGLGDMQGVLDLAWEHLLPGMTASSAAAGRAEALEERCEKLALPVPQGKAASPIAARVSGRVYRLDSNPEGLTAAEFVFRGDRCTLQLRTAEGERRLRIGLDDWARGIAPLLEYPQSKVAGRGAWTADDTFVASLCYYETPYIETVTCKFSGDGVAINRKMNVNFGPAEKPALIGRVGV